MMGVEIRNAILTVLGTLQGREVYETGERQMKMVVHNLDHDPGFVGFESALAVLRRAVAGTVPDARPASLAQSLRWLGFGARDRGI